MPDFEIRARGDARQATQAMESLSGETTRLLELQKKATTVAADYSRTVALTSKEASALGRSMGLTAGEARKLVAAEKLAAGEAKALAQAQMQADQKTRGLKDSAASAAHSMQSLATGMQAAFSAAIVQQVISASTQLIALADAAGDAREGLDLMTGGQADARIEAITTALRGTVSEAQAAAAAQHLLATGLDLSAQQTAEVVRVASRLGEVYGGLDLESAITKFEGLAETMSSRAGRQFGLDMELARTRAAELMATTPGLTQEMANLTAILEQASVKADMVDQTLDGADLAMQQSATAAEGLKVALGEMITEQLEGAIVGYRNLVVGLRDVIIATRDASQNALQSAGSFEEYAAQMRGAGLMTQSTYDEIESGIPSLFANRAQINRMREAWEEYQATQQDANAAMREATDAARRQAAATGFAIPPVQELAASEEDLAEAQREAEEAARAHEQALRDQQREHGALIGIAQQVTDSLSTLGTQGYLANAASGQAFLDFLKATGRDLSLTNQALIDYMLSQGLMTQQQAGLVVGQQAIDQFLTQFPDKIGTAAEAFDLFATGQSGAAQNLLDNTALMEQIYSGWGVTAATAAEATAAAQDPAEQSAARINEAVQAITANAPLAMAAIADNAPKASESLAPMVLHTSRIMQFFQHGAELAETAFAAISESFVKNWEVWGTSAGFINGMRESLAWMLAHNNISININTTGSGGIPTGVGQTSQAGGGSFVATGPVHMTVGEKPGNPELVQVTPLGAAGMTTYSGPNMLQMAGGGSVLAGLGGAMLNFAAGSIVIHSAASNARELARELIPELAREARAQGLSLMPEAA